MCVSGRCTRAVSCRRATNETQRSVTEAALKRVPRRLAYRCFITPQRLAMKTVSIAAVWLALLAVQAPSRAAADAAMLRLVSCQDSWLDWKDDAPRMTRFASSLERQYARSQQGDSFVPKAPMTLLGHPVAHVFPQSVGMGLGYSVLVNAPLALAREGFEKQLGQPMRCSTSDGIDACELPLGEKKTAMLMASASPGNKTTLLGCYYYYEK